MDSYQPDLELINILYMQDIDLGIGRDVFDGGFHIDDETGFLKHKTQEQTILPESPEVEKILPVNNFDNITASNHELPMLNLDGRYDIDTETGELILVSSPAIVDATDAINVDRFASSLVIQQPQQTFVSPAEVVSNSQTSSSQPAYQRQSSIDLRWNDVLSILDLQTNVVEGSSAGADAAWEQLGDLGSMMTQNGCIGFSDMQPQFDNFTMDSNNTFVAQQDYEPAKPAIYAFDNQMEIGAPFTPFSSTLNLNEIVDYELPDPASIGLGSDCFNTITETDFTAYHVPPPITVIRQPVVSMPAAPKTFERQKSSGSSTLRELLTAKNPMEVTIRNPQTNVAAPTPPVARSAPMDVDLPTTSVAMPTVAVDTVAENSALIQLLCSDLLPDDLDLDDVMEESDVVNIPLNEAWSTDSPVSSISSPGQQSLSGSTFDDSTSFFSTSSHSHHRLSDGSTYDLGVYETTSKQRSRSQIKEEERREREDRATRSRDEKRAKGMKIPLTMDEIIDSSVEVFTELLSRYNLNDAQLQLVRDIRRRGKNKLAAQNCRKRKMEVIQTVEEQVLELRRQRDHLRKERASLDRGAASLKDKLARLELDLFHRLRNESGQEYDPAAFSLLQTDDGGLFIVPRDNTTTQSRTERSHDEKNERKRKPKKKD